MEQEAAYKYLQNVQESKVMRMRSQDIQTAALRARRPATLLPGVGERAERVETLQRTAKKLVCVLPAEWGYFADYSL